MATIVLESFIEKNYFSPPTISSRLRCQIHFFPVEAVENMLLQLMVFAGQTGDDGAEGFLLGDAEGIPGFHQTCVFFGFSVGDEGNFQI